MSLEWKDSLENVDWQALSDLYRVAPLGNKSAPHLQRVFSNSLYRCFVYDDVTQLLGHPTNGLARSGC